MSRQADPIELSRRFEASAAADIFACMNAPWWKRWHTTLAFVGGYFGVGLFQNDPSVWWLPLGLVLVVVIAGVERRLLLPQRMRSWKQIAQLEEEIAQTEAHISRNKEEMDRLKNELGQRGVQH